MNKGIFLVSCMTEFPEIENTTVVYGGWNGTYPAPPGVRVVYACPPSSVFTDGSPSHSATCSSRRSDSWETSFHGKDVRCRCKLLLFQNLSSMLSEHRVIQNSIFDAIASVTQKDIFSIICLETLMLNQESTLVHQIVY